jgi:hypothetical protein
VVTFTPPPLYSREKTPVPIVYEAQLTPVSNDTQEVTFAFNKYELLCKTLLLTFTFPLR